MYARRTLSAIVAILALLLAAHRLPGASTMIGAAEPGQAGYQSVIPD